LPTNAEPDLLLDTSAALALVIEDHDHFSAVSARVESLTLGLAGHAHFEVFSTLTRLPEPMRVTASVAAAIIVDSFPESRFLGENGQAALLAEFAAGGISGGAVYDALVGCAAREHGVTLLTCDRRAERTYQALGVTYEFGA
jgi:predicted nucleic acid-binding protein